MPSRLVLLGGLMVLLATGVRPYSDDICPNDEFIQHCTCKVTGLGLYVVCTHVQSFDNLKHAFKTLSDYGLGRLLIHELRAPNENLPSDLFVGMHVEVLRFTECEFNIVADARPVFSGLENSLVRLEFRNGNVGGDGLVKSSLSHLNNLKDLIMTENLISQVPSQWLANGPSGLDKLELDKNHIKKVENGSFSNLRELISISLKKNELTQVTRSVLPHSGKLEEIDLSFNQLTELPTGFFDNMGSLRIINLQGNHIATLTESIWKPAWGHLQEIYLQGNPLTCDNHISWALEVGRPPTLEGTCVAPEAQKGKELGNVILGVLPVVSENRLVRQGRQRRRRIQT